MRLLLAMIWLKTNSLGIKQQSLTHPNIPRNVHWIDGPLKHSRFVFHLISTKGTTVPNLFLCWQHLFFNRFWWFFLLYTKFYLWNMQTDLYGSYCFLRYKGVKMGPTPKVLNFIFSLILMAFLLWNFLPMFFKQIWPSSYGCRYKWYQRRPKWTNTQLFFYYKSNLYTGFSIAFPWKIPVCSICDIFVVPLFVSKIWGVWKGPISKTFHFYFKNKIMFFFLLFPYYIPSCTFQTDST
jgi:hypothetical protein